jgi:sulfite dehydrogenase (quinone) subunit SoeC
MHPAFSVIFFTTASGAGYGLLCLIGLSLAFGLVPPDRVLGLVGLGLALALISAGLLASTLHLGHPERAWRALSQWRSSWLSREGVASLVTYVPALVLALGWVVLGEGGGVFAVAGVVAAICALVTVATTGMIYASLKPIPDWASPWTVPVYLVLALMTGSVLLDAVLLATGTRAGAAGWFAVSLIVLAWALKLAAWRRNDRLVPSTSANSATGLEGGDVRSIEWPHTAENYVLKEMGYRIARTHAARLRRFVHGLAFALPLVCTLLVLTSFGTGALVAAFAAVAFMVPGVLIERWLFFAEARHLARLYYE